MVRKLLPKENESHREDASRLLAKGCYEVANEKAGAVESRRITFTPFPPEGLRTILQSKGEKPLRKNSFFETR